MFQKNFEDLKTIDKISDKKILLKLSQTGRVGYP